jgi:Uma2 family endonuclease
MHAVARALVTEAEFLALPASAGKVELVDGEVVMGPAPTWGHQELTGNIYSQLRTWARERPSFRVGLAPVDIRFGPGRILQPDVFVLDRAPPIRHVGPLDIIPLVCIEVLSADRVTDRIFKRMLYAAAGVAEYWTVEPSGLVERWTGAGLTQSELLADRLVTPVLPDFTLDVAELVALMRA